MGENSEADLEGVRSRLTLAEQNTLLFLTLLGRKGNPEFRPPGGSGTMHQVMGSAFSMEERLVPRRLPGTSLIALVQLD